MDKEYKKQSKGYFALWLSIHRHKSIGGPAELERSEFRGEEEEQGSKRSFFVKQKTEQSELCSDVVPKTGIEPVRGLTPAGF